MSVFSQPACVLGCPCATSELPQAYCMCLHTLPSVHTSLEFHVTSDLQGSVNLQRSPHAEAGLLTWLLNCLGAACTSSEAGFVRLQVLTVWMQGSQIEIVLHNNKRFHTYFRKRRYLFWHLWTCVGKFLVVWRKMSSVIGFSSMQYSAACRGLYYRARQILAFMMPATLVRQIALVLLVVVYWSCPLHWVCPDSARIQDVKRDYHECGTELSTVCVHIRRMPLESIVGVSWLPAEWCRYLLNACINYCTGLLCLFSGARASLANAHHQKTRLHHKPQNHLTLISPNYGSNAVSHPGPKSGSSSNGRCRLAMSNGTLLWLLFVLLHMYTATGARVAGDSTTPAEVMTRNPHQPSHIVAKPSGNLDHSAQHTFIRKRAYKRAVNRALANGTTWYRGRKCSYQQLAGNQPWPTPNHCGSQRPSLVAKNGVWVLSWNVGGLTNAILDELQVWLRQPANSHIQVVMLQETRWQFSSDWSSPHWHFVHSGHTKQKGSGVLTMVSTAVADPHDIRAREILPGRVLPARVQFKGRSNCVDLLNVYQHAWDTPANALELSSLRSKVLLAVEDAIRLIPQRNLCVCAGDFNVQLKRIPGLVGANTVLKAKDSQAAPDMESLADMISTLNLVALNTWSGQRRCAHTFKHQGFKSQIDFIFVRRHEATPLMRQCKPQHGFPVTAWRLSGLHVPLCTCLNFRWRPPPNRDRQAKIDSDQVNLALKQQLPVLQQFRQAVAAMTGHVQAYSTEVFNQALMQQGALFFPEVRQPRCSPSDADIIKQVARSRWKHFQLSRQHARSPGWNGMQLMNRVFMTWMHFAKFRGMRREANKASRDARRDRFERLLTDAAECAASLNMQRLFKVVRQLAPKQPYRRMKLYGPNGEILSIAQEAQAIKTHFEAILHDDEQSQTQLGPQAVATFSLDEMHAELARIPANKATPKHLAPGVLWRAAAPIIAPVLVDTLDRQWCDTAIVPQSWKDGWVALAQKPGKPGRDPGDFRPLCLQDPVGKAVLKLIAMRIRPRVQAYASNCPQHAYLKGRSAEGALLAVFDKCREIRTLAQAARRDIFAKRQGIKSTPHAGGLVLSLDMSMAFDIVPRCHIQAALLEAGVSAAEVALIMEWLLGSTYHIKHGSINLSITTERGVRQGCVLSPLVWTCFTCYVIKRLDPIISLQDLQLYADDFLMCKIFHTKEQFVDALRSIPILMRHLRSFGLKINVNKTAVLIRMAHRDGRHMLKQHLCRNKTGVFLQTIEAQAQYLPVKQSHKYLGCIISLHDFESLTFQYRLEMGKNQFSRLRSVLVSHRCLSLARRAYMWQICVWTTLSYGLNCSGCTSLQLQQRFACLLAFV